jgi:3'-5' exoribonuclease
MIQRTPSDGGEWIGTVSCQIAAARPGTTRNGKPYVEFEITDGTASDKFKLWNDSPSYDAAEDFQAGDFVAIDAMFRRNQFGLNVDRAHFRPLSADETAGLLAGTPERRAFLAAEYASIVEAVATFEDPRLRLLCQAFLSQYGERFQRAAAARDYHHARRGGLLEHTAQMMRGARGLRPVYPHLHWDLVQAGALLHDCGKLWENDYQAEGFVMPHTLMGELLGHISIGIEVVNALWRTLHDKEEFKAATPDASSAEQVRLHLLHLIASHHGQREYGAPVTPRTAEGWALHYLDNLDARVEMLRAAYAEKPQLAPGIYERRMPLEGHPVSSLIPFPKTVSEEIPEA